MWAIRPTRGGTMLVGIAFFAVCITIGITLVSKLEDHYPSLSGSLLVAIVLTIGFGIPITTTNLFEFPTLFGKPTVATFDENGNLVYHRWGLYTPPGLEVVNAREGDSCNVGTVDYHVALVEKNGWIYRVTFRAMLVLENPKTFYFTRSRRNQRTNICSLKEDLERSLVTLIARENPNLGNFCVGDPPMTQDGQLNEVPERCPGLGKFFEDKLASKYAREGVRVEVDTSSWFFWPVDQ